MRSGFNSRQGKRSGDKYPVSASSPKSWTERAPLYALCLLLSLTVLIGGASREDVPSLVILRPAAILLLGYGAWGLGWRQVRTYRFLFGISAAMLLLALVQLIPLPPAVWSRLPGRGIIAQIDSVARLGPVWRPISMAPATTWNSFFAMLVPLGILVLGARLAQREKRILLPLTVLLGVISGMIAFLQILGPANGPLYFYRVTNFGAAVGLFANRNHQAVFLASMFPMLAVLVSLPWRPGTERVGIALAVVTGMFLVPLIFITGSRGGLVSAAIGIVSVVWLYRPVKAKVGAARSTAPGNRKVSYRRRSLPVDWGRRGLAGAVLVLVLCLSVISVTLGRGEAFQRILAPDGAQDFRFKAWGFIAHIAADYFPVGSGVGSFVQVYQMYEPRRLLDVTYLNHAHNDWLEVVMTGGLAALALLLFASGLTFVRAVQLVRRGRQDLTEEELFARLGLVLVVQFAIASVGDYPLRTPALAAVFALAALWAATPLRKSRYSVGTGKVGSGTAEI